MTDSIFVGNIVRLGSLEDSVEVRSWVAVVWREEVYADDTVLLVSDKDINTVSVHLGNEVTNSYNWLVNNKLSMPMGKTEQDKKKLTKDFSIKCHTHNVCASNQVK